MLMNGWRSSDTWRICLSAAYKVSPLDQFIVYWLVTSAMFRECEADFRSTYLEIIMRSTSVTKGIRVILSTGFYNINFRSSVTMLPNNASWAGNDVKKTAYDLPCIGNWLSVTGRAWKFNSWWSLPQRLKRKQRQHRHISPRRNDAAEITLLHNHTKCYSVLASASCIDGVERSARNAYITRRHPSRQTQRADGTRSQLWQSEAQWTQQQHRDKPVLLIKHIISK